MSIDSRSTDPQERARQRVLVEQRVATECSDKEGWFTATLRTSEDDGAITWRICLLGPAAYSVNPLTDSRPRASPYRSAEFEADCTFDVAAYPKATPSLKFLYPVFHPHVYSSGGVDRVLTDVLWQSVSVKLSSKPTPVLLAHLLLELLAYPTVPEPVVARTTAAPADEPLCAFTVLFTDGVDKFEAEAREVAALSRRLRRGRSRLPLHKDSDTDEDLEVLAVGTIVQALGLWQLVLEGRVHDVHRLVDAGVDLHSCSGVPMRPLLSWAARSEAGEAHQIAIMQMLVKAGANVNQRCPFGRTPLMEAAKSGAEEAVYLLLAAGADVELTDASGSTAFEIALAADHFDCAELVRPADVAPLPSNRHRRRSSASSEGLAAVGTDSPRTSASGGRRRTTSVDSEDAGSGGGYSPGSRERRRFQARIRRLDAPALSSVMQGTGRGSGKWGSGFLASNAASPPEPPRVDTSVGSLLPLAAAQPSPLGVTGGTLFSLGLRMSPRHATSPSASES